MLAKVLKVDDLKNGIINVHDGHVRVLIYGRSVIHNIL